MKLLNRLWKDEAGFVVSAELVLVASVAVLAMIVGLAAARDGINSELADVADSFQELNQGYVISNILGHAASVAGSNYVDASDFCEAAPDGVTTVDEACITHTSAVGNAETTVSPPPGNA